MRTGPEAVGALLLLVSIPALAQESSSQRVTGTANPHWTRAWGPLSPITDHARGLPVAPGLPRMLVLPEPEIGLLWTAGNPGALPFEVQTRWNELRFAGTFDDGRYRRPMDPNDVEVIQFSGLGWQRVGAHGAAIGRLAFDRETHGTLRFADVLDPHSSNPLVVADSSRSDMRRVRARFEGGFGWRFGQWGLGATAGIETRDHRADQTPIPRRSRISTAGASLGIAHELPLGLKLGGHVRWQRDRETVNVLARLRDAVIFLLQGYADPPRQEVKPPATAFGRLLESDAWLWGLSAAGAVAGADWILVVERGSQEEGHFSAALQPDPAKDRWDADGWTLTGAVQRAFLDDRLLATARARYSTLDGDATLSELEGVVFRASESVFDGRLDLRYAPGGSPWSAALVVGLHNESRERRDFVIDVFSDIDAWTPGVGLEVARRFGGSTSLSAGYSIGFYSATSSIPNPESMGPVYRQLIAPELALYATQSRPNLLALAWRQELGGSTTLLFRGERESAAPHSLDPDLPFAPPDDSRTLWRLSLSLLLRE